MSVCVLVCVCVCACLSLDTLSCVCCSVFGFEKNSHVLREGTVMLLETVFWLTLWLRITGFVGVMICVMCCVREMCVHVSLLKSETL